MPDNTTGAYSLYVVRCANGSLYTGISTDVDRRLSEHGSGRRGARALRGKGPLQIVFSAEVGSRSRASRLEHRVKQLSKLQKEALVAGKLRLDEIDAGL